MTKFLGKSITCNSLFQVNQSEYFECICGTDLPESSDPRHRVQCSECKLWQHSECVKYDVADPYRGEYICPHCWTLQVSAN